MLEQLQDLTRKIKSERRSSADNRVEAMVRQFEQASTAKFGESRFINNQDYVIVENFVTDAEGEDMRTYSSAVTPCGLTPFEDDEKDLSPGWIKLQEDVKRSFDKKHAKVKVTTALNQEQYKKLNVFMQLGGNCSILCIDICVLIVCSFRLGACTRRSGFR